MVKIKIISIVVCLSVFASFCQALTNYYVVPPPNAGWRAPFTNWDWAATNIQDVINIALGGDTIYVTNGHYYLTNQITVSKGVIIRSFNNGITDPTNTIIDGNQYEGILISNRCMYITTTATVDGLTLTNGRSSITQDGGAGCAISAGGILTNCIITGNKATHRAYVVGGGISAGGSGTVIANCQIIGNTTMSWGGGIYMGGGVLKNCFIGWNYTSGNGAGVSLSSTASAFNCDIVSNNGIAAFFTGAGAVVSNCTIRGNTNCTAFTYYTTYCTNNLITHSTIVDNYGANGVGGTVDYKTMVRNCLIARNRSTGSGSGLYFNNATGYVESCTIVSNYAAGTAGGIYNNDASVFTVSNTIVCSNTSSGVYKDLYVPGSTTNYFYNSLCKTVSLPPARGNITNDPVFVDFNSGNYRLVRGSPCINTGANQDWMTGAFDLDGRRRIDRYSGVVDIGCYEYVPSGFMFSGR